MPLEGATAAAAAAGGGASGLICAADYRDAFRWMRARTMIGSRSGPEERRQFEGTLRMHTTRVTIALSELREMCAAGSRRGRGFGGCSRARVACGSAVPFSTL